MNLPPELAALWAVRALRVGPLRLSAYGACAAAGVVLAMALTRWAARRLDQNPETAWDAGLFAIVSCLFASRLLLVLSDPMAFLHFPLLILSLPSLTLGGLSLAGIATWVYLLRKRVRLLPLLDSFAPGSALLAGFLELGHVLDGSEPGMPVFRPHTTDVVGARPVAAYGIAASLALAVLLWASLRRLAARPGRAAALALSVGGLVAYLLSMLTLPSDLFATAPLEPGQIVALTALLAGGILWTLAPAPKASDSPVPADASTGTDGALEKL